MQDRFKFRGWNPKANKMFNIDVLAISPCTWDCPDYGTTGVSLAYQPSIIVMQCTGKKIDDTLLFEGDICLSADENEDDILYIVEWNDKDASFRFELIDRDTREHISYMDFANWVSFYGFKIINNIYEEELYG